MVYNIPFNVNQISELDEFKLFKNNDDSVNKVVFALNNLPEKVHKVLFSMMNDVCDKYFFISLTLECGQVVNLYHNFIDIDKYLNNVGRYIYVRVNLIDNSKLLNHVNCIIVDKYLKYILLFDPKGSIGFELDAFESFIDGVFVGYTKLFPWDIGYRYSNRLQVFDSFCQSYVVLAFMLVVCNPHVLVGDFSIMFNDVINYEFIGIFLFYVRNLLIGYGVDIGEQMDIILWSYPTRRFNQFFRWLFGHGHKLEQVQVKVKDDEDDNFIHVNL
jgi:hypothetical protein